MVVFQHRAWKLLATYEKIIGLWPYQSKIKSYALRICASFFIISAMMTFLFKMIKEPSTPIFLENVTILLLLMIITLKFMMPIVYNKQRRNLYEKVVEHFKTIEDEDEFEVLQKHSNQGLRFSFIYTGTITGLWSIVYSTPFASMLYNYIIGKGELKKWIPLHIDYIVLDEQQHFYIIMVHLFLYTVACLIIDFAFDLSFIIFVRHVCALFEIVRIRLEKASNILDGPEFLDNYEHNIKEVNNLLSNAIIMHNEVLKMVELIEEAFNISWFFILLNNTVMVGTTLLASLFILSNTFNLVKYSMAFTAFLVHFFVVFWQGQKIIDSSSSVFDACYNCSWYIAPKKSCTLLSLMMSRSFKPSFITGGKGIFHLSMKTYSEMLRFGFSMFTVLNTLQQKRDNH